VFLIYVVEAHPEDEWQLDSNLTDGVIYSQPKEFVERVRIATEMLRDLQISIPTLVDSMDNAAANAFAAWPERIFVADAQGKIAYAGEPGPFGFDPAGARDALIRLL
jgi:type I thyroxine 5'-deiodinase